MSETSSAPVFMTVAQFCEKHAWARPGGIRSAIFFARDNGFEGCLYRFGRKLLLDEAKVLEWIRQRGNRAGSLQGESAPSPRRPTPSPKARSRKVAA